MKALKQNILITGGAGFIGVNLASYYAREGSAVEVFDNFSRRGTQENITWLKKSFPNIIVTKGDIRSKRQVKRAITGKDVVYHLAAQVAVTSSITSPREDFEINAYGTFNVLEAIRVSSEPPILIFASTNKVYGSIEDIPVVKKKTRYIFGNYPHGISESYPVDFHSPYGCSKGAADQYVRDYHRIYNLPTVVFRQSCIYGPHQFGLEDQGWLAWFMIAAIHDKPITIYGDGLQVRDILYIDDLIQAFILAIDKIDKTAGQIYNVGGGVRNTLSVWSEFGPYLEQLTSRKIKVKYAHWRPGDQKVYISNINKIKKELNWQPEIGVKEGIRRLFDWIKKNKNMLVRYF